MVVVAEQQHSWSPCCRVVVLVVDCALEDLLEAVAAADVGTDLDGSCTEVLGGADEAVVCAVHVDSLPLAVARSWLKTRLVECPA